MTPSVLNHQPTETNIKERTVKIDFGRPSKTDLKDVIDASDERLNQSSSFVYSPSDTGQVNMNDLAKGSELGIPAIPDDGFPPREVLGGVKSPW